MVARGGGFGIASDGVHAPQNGVGLWGHPAVQSSTNVRAEPKLPNAFSIKEAAEVDVGVEGGP